MTHYQTGLEFALEMDQKDPLNAFKDSFYIPKLNQKECIYFCGNSLGLQPKSITQSVLQELGDWQELGVEGHFQAKNPWMPYHELLTEPMARLVGARTDEVVLMNSLTVNLHLMMVSFYQPTSQRYKILMDSRAFPSDRYAVTSQLFFHGIDPKDGLLLIEPNKESHKIELEGIEQLLSQEGESIALILLEGVNYYSGQVMNIQEITTLGHRFGSLVGWDLAHAVGNIPLQLHDWQVDFAVWCTYKYLNGGPGCIGGCFVHQNHSQDSSLPRFAGWWGHDKATRFTMPETFQPITGAEGWQLSNPAILPLACLKESLAIFTMTSMNELRKKSLLLTGYLIFLLEQFFPKVIILTPKEESERGSQLSLVISNGKSCYEYLKSQGVICDWREPDVIRLAPVPLYNRFVDCYNFVHFLKEGLA